jgi:beta-glucosidase
MKLGSTLLLIALTIQQNAMSQVNNKIQQPTLGSRTAKIIKVDGFSFKDLNKNGKLDKYEDWRLSNEIRSKDLLSKMSLEEKVGFMLISSTRLKNDWSFETPKNNDPITSDFNEADLIQDINMFSKKPLPVPIMSAAGTTKAVTQFHLRHFILRANTSARHNC